MKTTFYFLCIALILTSCAGNSFLKQRYTHFAHAKARTNPGVAAPETPAALPLIATRPAEALPTQSEDLVYPALCLNSKPAASIPLAGRSAVPAVKPVKNAVRSLPNSLLKQANVQQQKNKQEKRGLIGAALSLVLYIILVAVIVALIIIVVLALV